MNKDYYFKNTEDQMNRTYRHLTNVIENIKNSDKPIVDLDVFITIKDICKYYKKYHNDNAYKLAMLLTEAIASVYYNTIDEGFIYDAYGLTYCYIEHSKTLIDPMYTEWIKKLWRI